MNRSLGVWLGDDRENIGLAEDQVSLGVDRDFGSTVLSVENLVTDLQLHRNANVLLLAAGADGDDLALLRLFLGGIGDEQRTPLLFGLLERSDHDAVCEGGDFGARLCFCSHN